MKRIKLLSFAVLASHWAGPAGVALAAKGPAKLAASTPWLAYLCVGVALAGVCFIAFRVPKRSHGE